jgi:hypothetical protein
LFGLKTNRKENIFGAFHEPETFLPIVMKGVEMRKIQDHYRYNSKKKIHKKYNMTFLCFKLKKIERKSIRSSPEKLTTFCAYKWLNETI